MKDIYIFHNATSIKEIGNLKDVCEPLKKHVQNQKMTGFEFVNVPAQQQPQQSVSLPDKESFPSRSPRIRYEQQPTKRQLSYRNKCP